MNELYEFFFCPQHGVLRPDNVACLIAYASNFGVMVQCWYVRMMSLFGRFLG